MRQASNGDKATTPGIALEASQQPPILDEIDQPLAEANIEAHAGIDSDILGDDRHRRPNEDGRLIFSVPVGCGDIGWALALAVSKLLRISRAS